MHKELFKTIMHGVREFDIYFMMNHEDTFRLLASHQLRMHSSNEDASV
jgi:hypothetical protein